MNYKKEEQKDGKKQVINILNKKKKRNGKRWRGYLHNQHRLQYK